MLKIIGLTLLSLSVASIGFIYSERLSFRKRYLEQLMRFSNSFINEMQNTGQNLFTIFSCVSEKELEFLKCITKADITDSKALKQRLKSAGLFFKDFDTVAAFLMKLGTSDIDSQRLHCQYYAAKFSDSKQEAEIQSAEKGKPARILSVLGSMALFIILI